MFDDQQPQSSGSIPPNLPIGEPDDMFAGTDAASDPGALPPQPTDPVAKATVPTPQTALGAGILKPKEASVDGDTSQVMPPIDDSALKQAAAMPSSAVSESEVAADRNASSSPADMFAAIDTVPAQPDTVSTMPVIPTASLRTSPATQSNIPTTQGPQNPQMTVPPAQMSPDNAYSVSEPIGNRKTLMWIIIAVVFVVLGIGGAWAYFAIVRESNTGFFDTTVPETNTTTEQTQQPIETTPVDTTPDETVVTSPTTTIGDKLLLGEPLDTDADGLDDVRERDLGTNPLNWDSDGDGLDDAAEVTIWKTDPLDSDTDDDGFSDGTEIKNGYSPTGPGKLFTPPTSTKQ